MKKNLLLISAFLLLSISAIAQNTVGLLQHDEGSLDAGYVLFSPTGSTSTYLIDKCGRLINEWESEYTTGHAVYLLEDGSLIRAGNIGNTTFAGGGIGGILERFDWEGNITWSYVVSDELKVQHHDYKVLPNGNILVIAWEMKTQENAIAAGRNPALVTPNVWGEQILEIEPIGTDEGNIVWEWHVWDHLVQDFDSTKAGFADVSENPGLININYKADDINPDWLHWNSIDYNAELDQIVVSVHKFSELWVIDHSTTTDESAGHSGGNAGKGGDILYRWGNPAAYDNGTIDDQKLFKQHNVHWIEEGLPFENQIMIYNNGNGRTGGSYSTAEIINPPLDGFNYDSTTLPYSPETPSWLYNDGNPNDYYARNMSSAQQLSNGNVLLCNSPSGSFTEITTDGEQVWHYVNPVHGQDIWNQGDTAQQNVAFRCLFYPSDYPGFEGLDLTAGEIIEDVNTMTESCELALNIKDFTSDSFLVYPNPASDYVYINNTGTTFENALLSLYSQSGTLVYSIETDGSDVKIPVSGLASGIYLLRISSGAKQFTTKIIVK